MIETLETWRLLRELRRGARRSPDSIARLQSALLRATVEHAYERVPHYRRRWDEAGLDPSGVRGLDDLERIPLLSGESARAAIERGELVARGLDPERLPAFPTSGSTGRPLRVPRGPAEQRLWRAVALRTWFEHDYSWSHVTVHLDPHAGPPHPLQRLGVGRTVWISTRVAVEEQVARLARARPDVVVATPTVLRRVARAAAAGGVRMPRLRLVFAHGEVLDPATALLVERVLGSAPIGLYGLTELGYVAWQCERREGYHLNADACLVEVVRDGRPAPPGEVGAVVATSLRARTVPLVRYETGDLAVAADGPCPCGRTLPLLRSVEGRARDAVALADGRLVTTRALVEHMAGVLPPDGYRVSRTAAERFRVHLEDPARNGAVGRLRALLGEVEVDRAAGVPSLPGGGDKTRPLTAAPLDAPP